MAQSTANRHQHSGESVQVPGRKTYLIWTESCGDGQLSPVYVAPVAVLRNVALSNDLLSSFDKMSGKTGNAIGVFCSEVRIFNHVLRGVLPV